MSAPLSSKSSLSEDDPHYNIHKKNSDILDFIKTEIESLRIISRRVELHQAIEVSALKEVNGRFILHLCVCIMCVIHNYL